jgi:uncharacterized membrane protein
MSHGHLGAGIAVAIVSTLCYNLGFVIEKLALQRLPTIHARRAGHMLRTLATTPLWVLGFCCLLVGLGLQVVALSMAPISIVQPIFASGIVLLLVLSHLVLHDRLGRTERIGVLVILVSLLLLGLSVSSGSNHVGSGVDGWGIAMTAVPSAEIGVILFLAAERMGGVRRRSPLQGPMFGLASGVLYGVSSLGIKAVSTMVATMGLVRAVPHVIFSPYLYLAGVGAAAGLLLFQTGLQRCNASVLVPVSNATSSAYLVAAGSLLFHESLPHDPAMLLLRLVGFAGVLGGLAVLATSKTDPLTEAAQEEARHTVLWSDPGPGSWSHPNRTSSATPQPGHLGNPWETHGGGGRLSWTRQAPGGLTG